MFFRFVVAVLMLPLLAFSPARQSNSHDLSTPEKSFDFFVEVLQSGSTDLLEHIVTPTGIKSLVTVGELDHYSEGISDLGIELAASELSWSEITEDIYFLTATFDARIHKLEFTKEEPGWMLYHWQLGGGVDAKTENEDSAPVIEFSFDD